MQSGERKAVYSEQEKILKEVVMAYLKVLSQHLPRTVEDHKKTSVRIWGPPTEL
jgi:hypothetical protein